MAEIFLARVNAIQGFEKYLVVKKILKERTDDPDFVRMFLDEARVAATLDHANIIQIYDVGQINGEYFIAMEYLRGRNLTEIVRAAGMVGLTQLPLGFALSVVSSVCAGLHYAHEKRDFDGLPLGIVHRDVTPQNIMVTFDGGVKVVDFGIAKAASREVETVAGTLKGKIGYMSPEQCRGQHVDRRADLFAIGVILYELTTAKRAYRGPSEFDTMKKIIEGPVPSPAALMPDYPPRLDEIVQKCLQKSPDERYQSARELHAALEAFALDQHLSIGTVPAAQLMEQLFPDDVGSDPAMQGSGPRTITQVGSRSSAKYSGELRRDSNPLIQARRHHLQRRALQVLGAAVIVVGGVVTAWHLRGSSSASSSRPENIVAAHDPVSAPMEATQLKGGDDALPTLLEGKPAPSPDPNFPLTPTVLCRLLIDPEGNVVRSQIFRSRLELAAFEDAALKAVQAYRFTPARHAGKPVAVWIDWPVTFTTAAH